MFAKHLSFLTAAIACGSTLSAGSLALPTYSVGLTYSGGASPISQNYTAPGSYNFGGMSVGLAGSPDPSIQVSAGLYGSAGASESYYFTVSGGPDGTTVPLLVFYSMTATASQTVSASSLALLNVRSYIDGASAEVGNLGLASQSMSGFLRINYLIGTAYDPGSVTLQASASGPSTAFVDPFIEVDPSFLNASSYSVTVSPGIGNSALSSTPEPASFALVGVGLIGAMLVRRRLALHCRG